VRPGRILVAAGKYSLSIEKRNALPRGRGFDCKDFHGVTDPDGKGIANLQERERPPFTSVPVRSA